MHRKIKAKQMIWFFKVTSFKKFYFGSTQNIHFRIEHLLCYFMLSNSNFYMFYVKRTS